MSHKSKTTKIDRDLAKTADGPASNDTTAHQFSAMSEADRIAMLGAFLAETSQFETTLKAVKRTYAGWRLSKSGTFTMVTGPSGVGKTTVADILLEDLEHEWEATVSDGEADVVEPTGPMPATAGIAKQRADGIIRPVVKVFVEPKARCRGLLRDILRALGIRAPSYSTFGDLMEMLELHLHKQEVRLVLLDEVHHIVEGQGATTAYEASEVIKMLLLQARVQVVCIGLPHALSIIDNNPELPRHLRGRHAMTGLSGELDPEGDYMRFLKSLSEAMPFDRKPDLAEAWTALRLAVATQFNVGRIMNLVQQAATLAIEDNLDTFGKVKLAEAYAAIEDVGDKENPFMMKACDETIYEPIRRKIAERRRKIATTGRRAAAEPSRIFPRLDFTK